MKVLFCRCREISVQHFNILHWISKPNYVWCALEFKEIDITFTSKTDWLLLDKASRCWAGRWAPTWTTTACSSPTTWKRSQTRRAARRNRKILFGKNISDKNSYHSHLRFPRIQWGGSSSWAACYPWYQCQPTHHRHSRTIPPSSGSHTSWTGSVFSPSP